MRKLYLLLGDCLLQCIAFLQTHVHSQKHVYIILLIWVISNTVVSMIILTFKLFLNILLAFLFFSVLLSIGDLCPKLHV